VKLLLDQNLSYKLVGRLTIDFPGSAHVQDFGLDRADDEEVWQFAKDGGFTIVSKDDDFHQRSFVYGHPPKVVWVRIGNCTTERIAEVLLAHAEDILRFGVDAEAALLVLS